AVLQRIFVDGCAALAEVARRVDVRSAVVRHREKHHGISLYIARIDERFLVRLPYPVDDGRLSRIGRRTVIKIPAQINDPQALSSLASGFARTMRAQGGSQRRASAKCSADDILARPRIVRPPQVRSAAASVRRISA